MIRGEYANSPTSWDVSKKYTSVLDAALIDREAE
jgi:hypothetical protein